MPNIKCAAATIINDVSLRAASDELTKNFLIWKYFESPSGAVYVWMLPHGYTAPDNIHDYNVCVTRSEISSRLHL